MFPQTGPPTERSGYVHLEGLHTGLSHDAVTVRRNKTKKRRDVTKIQNEIIVLKTLATANGPILVRRIDFVTYLQNLVTQVSNIMVQLGLGAGVKGLNYKNDNWFFLPAVLYKFCSERSLH